MNRTQWVGWWVYPLPQGTNVRLDPHQIAFQKSCHPLVTFFSNHLSQIPETTKEIATKIFIIFPNTQCKVHIYLHLSYKLTKCVGKTKPYMECPGLELPALFNVGEYKVKQ